MERETNNPSGRAIQWLSRTLSILILMVVPGMLGHWLDGRWGTQFLAPVGFAVGMVAATGILIALARRLTPPAGGNPLPQEDDQWDSGDHDQWNSEE